MVEPTCIAQRVASLDTLTTVPKEMLGTRIGLIPHADHQICQALDALADC